MLHKKPLSAPRPPTEDDEIEKKRLATSLFHHLVKEGQVPELTSERKPPYYVTIEELQEQAT